MSHSEQAHTEPVTPRSGPAPSKKQARPIPESRRKPRSDAGTLLFTDRDAFALSWIGQQYGIRLDQLQRLLGRSAGRGATSSDWISEGAARDVVTRWKRGQWVRVARIRAHEPFWIWPTRLGLRKVGLTYQYRDLEQSSLDDLKHLFAINEVRLAIPVNETAGWQWISERQLLQGVTREQGRPLLHRPDACILHTDGTVLALEVELSLKKPFELAENLMELLRGQDYLHLKMEHGTQEARSRSWAEQSRYKQIWYFAPKLVREHVRRELAGLIKQGAISVQESNRLYVFCYPPAKTEEERLREVQEERTFLKQELRQA